MDASLGWGRIINHGRHNGSTADMEELKFLNLVSSKYTELGLVKEVGTTNLRNLTNLGLLWVKEF